MSERWAFPAALASIAIPVAVALLWMRGVSGRELDRRERRWHARIEPGDLVFQDLDCGERCRLIRQVTRSPYVHVGIVLDESGDRVVWEALGPPVGPAPLEEVVRRGDGRIAIYRLERSIRARLPAIARAVRRMRGRPYDPDYQWDEERIYCSELVARAVDEAMGRMVFAPAPLGEAAFGQWSRRIAKRSHGRLSGSTPLVTPADLARSPHVREIVDELD